MLARFDQISGKDQGKIHSLSDEFSKEYHSIINHRTLWKNPFLNLGMRPVDIKTLLNLGMRPEDIKPLKLISKLDEKQHTFGPGHLKRFIFYAIMFYSPDKYACDLSKEHNHEFFSSYYGSEKEYQSDTFDEICQIFASKDYKCIQPIITKHRYIFNLTAKRVLYRVVLDRFAFKK